MRLRLWSWFMVWLCCGVAVQAQSIHREAFPSGITLVVAERHATPVVVVQAMVRAGSEHEGPLLGSGVSALVQRMLVNHPGRLAVDARERTGNQFEYEIGVGYALYRLQTTSEHVDDAIRALALLLRGEGLGEEHMLLERERLLAEQEQAATDPVRMAVQAVDATVYQAHAARLPITGRRDSLLGLRWSEVERYHRHRYTAPNVVLVVTGNIATERVRDGVRAAFAYFPEGGFDRLGAVQEPPQLVTRRRLVPARVPVERVFLAWRTVPLDHPDQAVLPVLARLLDAPGSPLRRRLEEAGLASGVGVAHVRRPGVPGYLLVRYEVRPEQRNAAQRAVSEALIALREEDAISADDLVASKMHLRRTHRAQDAAQQARELGLWELVLAAPAWGGRLAEFQDAVSLDQVRSAASTYLQPRRLSRVTLRPSAGEGSDEGRAPVDTHAGVSVPVEVTRFGNGVRVITQDVARGLVHLRFSLGGGAGAEDEHSLGATRLLAMLLGHETEGRDAEQLRAILDAHGMDLQVEADIHALHLSITCFPEDVELAIDLLSDCLLRPVLRGDALEWVRQRTMERLVLYEQLARWDQRLHDAIVRTVMDGHYAARSLTGLRANIAVIDRAVIRRHLDRLVVGGNLVVGVVGGRFDRAAVLAALSEHLGDPSLVPEGETVQPHAPEWPAAEPTQVQLNSDHDESALGLAWRAPGRDADLETRAAMDVMVALLGGVAGNGGRLGGLLRSAAEGAVIESRMGLEAYDRRGVLWLSVLVAEAQREAVRQEVLAALADLLVQLEQTGETAARLQQEIAAARAVCLTRASLLYEDLGDFAAALAETMLIDDRVDAFLAYRQAVQSIDRERLAAVARAYLREPVCRVQLTAPLPDPPVVVEDDGQREGGDEDSSATEAPPEGAEAED